MASDPPDGEMDARYWSARARRARGPVVEPSAVAHRVRVTFVYDGTRDAAEGGLLVCPAVPHGSVLMEPVGGGVFIHHLQLPTGSRVAYHFQSLPQDSGGQSDDFRSVLRQRRLDTFNPRFQRVPVAHRWLMSSVLELDGATALPGWRRTGVLRHGTAQITELTDRALTSSPKVVTFQPHRAAEAVVVLLESSGEWGDPATLFDDLHHHHPELSFVGHHVGGGGLGRRLRSLAHPEQDIIPLLGDLLDGSPDIGSGRVVVVGFSAAAQAALKVALHDPRRISLVAMLSGAFHLDQRMDILNPPTAPLDVSWLRSIPALPRRVYLAGGAFEGDGQYGVISQNLAVAQVLIENGVDVRCDGGPTGHELATAVARLSAALAWLLS